MVSNSRRFRNVGKGAISIVAEQPTGHRLVDLRNAIVMLSVVMNAARLVFLLAETHKLPNEQIQQPIIVIVKPHRTGSPSGCGDASLHGYVGECAVSIVVIQNAAPVLRHIEIGESVAIIVADGNTLTVSARGYASLFGDVRESAVAVVSIQSVPQWRIGRVKIALAAVDEIDVHPAVVVVIQERAAGACR